MNMIRSRPNVQVNPYDVERDPFDDTILTELLGGPHQVPEGWQWNDDFKEYVDRPLETPIFAPTDLIGPGGITFATPAKYAVNKGGALLRSLRDRLFPKIPFDESRRRALSMTAGHAVSSSVPDGMIPEVVKEVAKKAPEPFSMNTDGITLNDLYDAIVNNGVLGNTQARSMFNMTNPQFSIPESVANRYRPLLERLKAIREKRPSDIVDEDGNYLFEDTRAMNYDPYEYDLDDLLNSVLRHLRGEIDPQYWRRKANEDGRDQGRIMGDTIYDLINRDDEEQNSLQGFIGSFFRDKYRHDDLNMVGEPVLRAEYPYLRSILGDDEFMDMTDQLKQLYHLYRPDTPSFLNTEIPKQLPSVVSENLPAVVEHASSKLPSLVEKITGPISRRNLISSTAAKAITQLIPDGSIPKLAEAVTEGTKQIAPHVYPTDFSHLSREKFIEELLSPNSTIDPKITQEFSPVIRALKDRLKGVTSRTPEKSHFINQYSHQDLIDAVADQARHAIDPNAQRLLHRREMHEYGSKKYTGEGFEQFEDIWKNWENIPDEVKDNALFKYDQSTGKMIENEANSADGTVGKTIRRFFRDDPSNYDLFSDEGMDQITADVEETIRTAFGDKYKAMIDQLKARNEYNRIVNGLDPVEAQVPGVDEYLNELRRKGIEGLPE
jgi:hypothetical protein